MCILAVRTKTMAQIYLVMIFSLGSGGNPTANCFCRTKISVAALAKSSTFFFNIPEEIQRVPEIFAICKYCRISWYDFK